MSYSQNNEEAAILEAVGDIRDGVLLDIGAYDGRTRSNSLALIEKGWEGVLVEPSPVPFAALVELHGDNPLKVTLMNCLIGVDCRIVGFWPSADGVSTTEGYRYELWKDTAGFGQMYHTAQMRIQELVAAFPQLFRAEVVSIDTEGTSVPIFRSFPFKLVRPRVFCVEYDDRLDELTSVADEQGYAVTYRSNENVVLVRR